MPLCIIHNKRWCVLYLCQAFYNCSHRAEGQQIFRSLNILLNTKAPSITLTFLFTRLSFSESESSLSLLWSSSSSSLSSSSSSSSSMSSGSLLLSSPSLELSDKDPDWLPLMLDVSSGFLLSFWIIIKNKKSKSSYNRWRGTRNI